MDTAKDNLEARLFAQFKPVGASSVAQVWQEKYRDLYSNKKALKWLEIAGGLSMVEVRSDFDLLVLADQAPNDLLFGLAYGKLSDALSMASQPILTPAHHVNINRGQRSTTLAYLYERVLDRGHELERQAEQNDDMFFEKQVTGQSRSDSDLLMKQTCDAPDAFTLGQMTSWVITNHRLRNPHLYTQMLSRLMLSDLSSEAITEYCYPARERESFSLVGSRP